MYEVFCIECGRGENDGVCVTEENGEVVSSIDEMPREKRHTKFHCPSCDICEVTETGVMPTRNTDHFDLRESACDDIAVKIDSNEIGFTDVDEQISTSTHYTTRGVRNTARVHNVHVHAVNPPSIEKGRHRIEIGDHLDEEMILGTIRYHNDNHRTLEFHRVLEQMDVRDEPQQNQFAQS